MVLGQRIEVVDLYALAPDIERHLLSVAPDAIAACGQPSMVLAVGEAVEDRSRDGSLVSKSVLRHVVGVELVVLRHHHQLPLRAEIEIAHEVGPVALPLCVDEIKGGTVVRGCETDHTGIFHAHPDGSRAVSGHVDDIVRGDDGIAVSGSVVVDVACGIVIDKESAAVGADIVFPVVSLGDGEDGVALLVGFQSGYEIQFSYGPLRGKYPQAAALVGDELQVVDGALYGPFRYLQRLRPAPDPCDMVVHSLGLQQQRGLASAEQPLSLPVHTALDGSDVSDVLRQGGAAEQTSAKVEDISGLVDFAESEYAVAVGIAA